MAEHYGKSFTICYDFINSTRMVKRYSQYILGIYIFTHWDPYFSARGMYALYIKQKKLLLSL